MSIESGNHTSEQPLEPRDLTDRLRRASAAQTGTESPPPPEATAEAPSSRVAAKTVSDWKLLHAVARAVLVCEETLRLYPPGHQRVRRATKEALNRIHEYQEQGGKALCFVPEVALDLTSTDRSPAAKDIGALGCLCRAHLIRSVTIQPEVDCDSIEAFVHFLQSPPQQLSAHNNAGSTAAPSWDHIVIELYDAGEREEGYRFTEEGDQLLVGSTEGNAAGGTVLDQFPPLLRKNLARVLGSSDIRECLDRLHGRLGLAPQPAGAAPPAAADEGRVDLVREIVSHLFDDPRKFVDTPEDVLRRKIEVFLRFLEGMAPSLNAAREGEQRLTPQEVRDLIKNAVGMQSWNQQGLPEIFQQTARLKALFEAPPAAATSKLRATTSPPPPETGAARGASAAGPPAPPPRAPGPAPMHPAPRPGAAAGHEVGADPILSSLEPLLGVEVPEREILSSVEGLDFALDALRIQLELMASEEGAESYAKKRDRFLHGFSNQKWRQPGEWVEELEQAVRVLEDQRLDDARRLTRDALGGQRSQSAVDLFFVHRLKQGADLADLRPLLQDLAADKTSRAILALAAMWKAADRDGRNHYVDEIFNLAPGSSELAEWAANCPQAFSSDHALECLRRVSDRTLEDVFLKVSAQVARARADAQPAAVTVLRAAAGKPQGERLLVTALRLGSPRIKGEALTVMESCSTREMSSALAHIVNEQNLSEVPNLDEVRLALTTLARSPLPEAREFLHRVRHERRLLRHVFRREIRGILDLLLKVEGVSV